MSGLKIKGGTTNKELQEMSEHLAKEDYRVTKLLIDVDKVIVVFGCGSALVITPKDSSYHTGYLGLEYIKDISELL